MNPSVQVSLSLAAIQRVKKICDVRNWNTRVLSLRGRESATSTSATEPFPESHESN